MKTIGFVEKDGQTDGQHTVQCTARVDGTSPGGQIDASLVVLYIATMFSDCFERFSAVSQEW